MIVALVVVGVLLGLGVGFVLANELRLYRRIRGGSIDLTIPSARGEVRGLRRRPL